jgi:eukaryotic-like serine/threonine-protein kinase
VETSIALPRSVTKLAPAHHCADDEALKQTVKSLLLARTKAGDFLRVRFIDISTPWQVTTPEISSAVPDDLPHNIRNYVLVRRAGSGGMGEVYEAQQIEPIRRTVALKLVKRYSHRENH